MKTFYQARIVITDGDIEITESSDVIFYNKETAERYLDKWVNNMTTDGIQVSSKDIVELDTVY